MSILFHEAEGGKGSQEALQNLYGGVLFVAAAPVTAASTSCRRCCEMRQRLGEVLRKEGQYLRAQHPRRLLLLVVLLLLRIAALLYYFVDVAGQAH